MNEPAEPQPSAEETFSASPLDELKQDPVAAALLAEQAVETAHALVALQKHRQSPGGSLWRLMAEAPGASREAVLEIAARVLGFERAQMTDQKPAAELVSAVLGLFPPQAAEEMFRLGLLPYEFAVDPGAHRHNLTLVTHDPSHPAVTAFTRKLPLTVQFRYAPEAEVQAHIQRVCAKLVAFQEHAEAQRAASEDRVLELAGSATSMQDQTGSRGAPGNRGVAGEDVRSVRDLSRIAPTDRTPEPGTPVPDRFDPVRVDNLSGDGYGTLEPPVVQPSASAEAGSGDPLSESESDSAAPEPEAGSDSAAGGGGASVPSGPPLDSAALEAIKSKDRVVAMLLRKEIVTAKHVQEAQHLQRTQKSKEALWRMLTQVGGVDREAIYAEAARVYAFPIAKIGDGKPDPEFARSVIDTFSEEKRNELFKLRILPFECDLEHQTGAIKLVFATHDPTRPEVHRLMQQLKLERFELRYAPEAVVVAAIHEAYPRKNEFLERMNEGGSMAFDLGATYESKAGLVDEDALEAEIGRSSLINLFEATLLEAVRQGCSDIHIFPNAQKKIEIHFRIDGRLNHWHTEDKVHPEALLAVIKDNATNVDRFERDAAQDGFIQRWIDEALIRFRVSVLPIANASSEIRSESIVIRVLDDRKVVTDLKKLGLLGSALERFDNAIRQPHGMVILTGPTGSGKSTTLVAALHQVVTPEVNVLTVEDPVEYIIPGVRQIKLNNKLDLEGALRSILRHDPDVVMVGEMRDKQTAELAIKLANTGHLTFSTLHTNDAPAAVSRLYKMGIEPFLIAYAINLVVAQRLIRVLCPECKTVDDDPDPIMLNRLGFSDEEIANTKIYLPGTNQSCKCCKGTGYKGRRAVTEALYFSRAIRHIIVESTKMIDEGAVRDQAVKEGMLTLADSAREYVKMGLTSVMEMVRVVTTEG